MTTISGENFKVSKDDITNTVVFDGTLRLRGLDEYQDISDCLDSTLNNQTCATINLQKLEFLNSSGIAMLSRFVIKARKLEDIKLIILGSNDVPWQGKSFKNLQRLMPKLELTFS